MEIVKICIKHGKLTAEKTCRDGKYIRCKECSNEKNKKSYYIHREKRLSTSARWRQQNKDNYNEWCREDRKKNPEKYKKYYENSIKKYGKEYGVIQDICSYFKISKEEYEDLFTKNENLCAICKKMETKKSRTPGEICRLAVDHCHNCWDHGKKGIKSIRGTLCHACNTAIGKFKDSPELLRKAALYLEEHKCST